MVGAPKIIGLFTDANPHLSRERGLAYTKNRRINLSTVYEFNQMVSLELEARLDNLLATAQEETKDIDLFAPIQERED